MFTSWWIIPLILFVDGYFGISFNQPKLDSSAKWNTNGTTFANETSVGKYPITLFINIQNNIYVYNQEINRILIRSTDLCASDAIAMPDQIISFSLFVMNNGDILIDNGYSNRTVDKVTSNGSLSVIEPVMYVNSSCTGLFVDKTNSLYCSLADDHRVLKVNLNENRTKPLAVVGTGCPGPTTNMLDHPHGIFVDDSLRLFVADTRNNRIQRFEYEQRNAVTVAGFGSSIYFLLSRPTTIVIDGNDVLYIIDSGNDRIVRSIFDGFECLIGCSKYNEMSQLNKPRTMAFDRNGNIYVTDSNNHRIRKYLLITNSSRKQQLVIPNLKINQTWKQNAITIAGGHGGGNGLDQLKSPWGMFLDDDQTIYIADTSNHRIMEWKKNATSGQIVAGGNGGGNRTDQLNFPAKVIIDQENDSLIICDKGNRRVVRWPRQNGTTGDILISNIDCRDLIMDNCGFLYVSDQAKHEIRRWKMGETNGTIVAGGNEWGNRLDQFNGLSYMFIDEDHSVYVSDQKNHRLMKWVKGANEGIVVAGGQGQGNELNRLSHPHGIIVDHLGSVYVSDQINNRVIRWTKGAEVGTVVVGGNGRGQQLNQFTFPTDVLFDRDNNLYILDHGNHRVQRFDVNENV